MEQINFAVKMRGVKMMVQRQALTDKILLLGVDGMDPRLTRKYVDEGKMPHL